MEAKNRLKNKKDLRNQFDALNHVLNTECIPAIEILCRLLQEEEKIKKEIKISRRAAGRGYGDIPILKRALLCLLCVRIVNIFDDNRGISLKNSQIKLEKNKVINDMIRTRHTWFGHIDKQINNIVSAKEVCGSDLRKRLENIKNRLIDDLFIDYK